MTDRKIQLPKTPAKSLTDGTLSARDFLRVWRLGSLIMDEVCRRAAKGDKTAREIILLAEDRMRKAATREAVTDMLGPGWGR